MGDRNISSGWKFTTYLVPSIPFRRGSSTATDQSTANEGRSGSISSEASSTSSATTASSNSSPGIKVPPTYLSGASSLLRCSRCLTHVCPTSSIISKGFTGRHGRAYLVGATLSTFGSTVDVLPNVSQGVPEERALVTGRHTVANINCSLCGTELGWRYLAAQEEDQQYKVGKYILETRRVVKGIGWEEEEGGVKCVDRIAKVERKKVDSDTDTDSDEDEEGDIVFDSQDEDECEDLFMGIWSEKLASKRRREKAWKMN